MQMVISEAWFRSRVGLLQLPVRPRPLNEGGQGSASAFFERLVVRQMTAKYSWEELTFALRKIFPAGTEIRQCPGTARDSYAIISSRGWARWIVPAHPGPGLGPLRAWQPVPWAKRTSWPWILAGLRLGLARVAPWFPTIAISVPPSCDWSHLGWPYKEEPSLTVLKGVPGPRQKAIVFLGMPCDRTPRLVTKVPLASTAKAYVRADADTLQYLASQGLLHGRVPQITYRDETTGVTSQTYLTGRPSNVRLTGAHIGLLSELTRVSGSVPLTPFIDAQRSRLGVPETRQVSGQGVLTLFDRLDALPPVPRVVSHGDMSPLNLVSGPEAALLPIDWEFSRVDGYPLLDLVFFLLSISERSSQRSVSRWYQFLRLALATPQARTYLASLDLPVGTLDGLATLAFIEYWSIRVAPIDVVEAVSRQQTSGVHLIGTP